MKSHQQQIFTLGLGGGTGADTGSGPLDAVMPGRSESQKRIYWGTVACYLPGEGPGSSVMVGTFPSVMLIGLPTECRTRGVVGLSPALVSDSPVSLLEAV